MSSLRNTPVHNRAQPAYALWIQIAPTVRRQLQLIKGFGDHEFAVRVDGVIQAARQQIVRQKEELLIGKHQDSRFRWSGLFQISDHFAISIADVWQHGATGPQTIDRPVPQAALDA